MTTSSPPTRSPRLSSDTPPSSASPQARRRHPPSWRDPRLVVGVALVSVSVLVGAVLFGRADDTVPVWVTRTALPEGALLRPADVVSRRVRLDDPATAASYLSARVPVPSGRRLSHDVGAGELLAKDALGDGRDRSLVEVPVSTRSELVPATVRAGSVVDVWVTPDLAAASAGTASSASPATTADHPPRAVLLFDDVPVVAAPAGGSSLSPSATRQVIVGVDAEQQGRLVETLAMATAGTIVLTKQG